MSCADDGTATGDLCFSGEYYTMSFGGKSGALVKESGSDLWHVDGDPGWKIEHLNDYTGSMFNGGQWKVTTADGTQYFFGRRVRFAGDAGTSSEQSVPVIGNHPGEPCYTSPDIKASTCWQNYKWNLDYVIDPAGNSMSYFYTQETQKYGIWNNQSTATFHRGALLHHIEYGTRAGSEGAGPAPYRIEFPTLWRCKPGSSCAWNDQPNFPDVPWDQFCDVSWTSCPSVQSPTFWILNKISAMETKVYDPASSTYKKLDRYDFPSSFPTVSDNSSPSLWLESVTHTGYDSDGTGLATPPVNFYGIQKNNRADHNVSTGSLPMVHYRVDRISSETGAVTTVTYSGEDCAAASPMPDPDMNTKRCFPQYWKPIGSPAGWAWWQKYVATQVTVTDSLGVSPVETWSYAYSNENSVPASGSNVLWAHNNGFMTPLPQRSWSDWRGYSQVVTTHGVAGQQPQTTVRRYYRGLHGDRTDAGWGTRGMNVWNSESTNSPDWENLRGQLWEEYALDNGFPDHFTIHDLQGAVLAVQITGEIPRIASAILESSTRTRNRVHRSSTWRVSSKDTTYDAERFPSIEFDKGDHATTDDDVCAKLTYNRNLTAHIMSTVSQTETFACPGGTIPNGAQPLNGSQTYYDGAADVTGLATAPTKGQPTRTKLLSANAPGYATVGLTEYDTLGRVVKATDARGRSATTAYTPAAAGATTQVVTTTPPPSGTGVGFATTTTINPHTGLPIRKVDPNGKTTEAYYDALGRVVSVWRPGRVRGIHSANVNYSYSISKTALPLITTSALGPDNDDRIVSYDILDSRFRPRQSQSVTQNGGRNVTDVTYDTAGRTAKTSQLGITGAPSGVLQAVTDSQAAVQHRPTYDDMGRQTTDELWGVGVKHSQVTTAYDGDSVTVTPPTGGTATTTFSDVDGRTTTLRQYLGSAPSGSFQDTTYGYDRLGRQLTATTAGSTWTTEYDIRGQVKRKIDPDNGITTMKYYDDGQLEHTVDAESRKVAVKYDGMGRRTGTYIDNIGGTQLASWVYDTLAKGQLTSSSRHVGSELYTTAVTAYDSGYRPLGTSVTIPDSVGTTLKGVYTTTFTYKANGAPETVTYPAAGTMAAETLTYAYNTAGQQTSITSPLDTYLASVTYDYDGAVLQSVHGKGDKRVMVSTPRQAVTGRMAASRVDTEKVSAPGGWEEQYTENYAYDLAGNVLGINETKGPATISNQCFGYDGLRRMTQSWTTAATTCQSTPSTGVLGGADPYWTSYQFDTAGNRYKELKHAAPGGGLGTDTERTYTTPGAGQPKAHSLTKVDTKVGSSPATTTDTFTYDSTGNTTTHNNATYTWNVLGKLSKVAISGGATTDFVYDADGNRVLRKDSTGTTTYLGTTEMHANTPVSSPTVTRTYPGAVRTTDGGLVWMIADHHGTSQTSIKATDLTVTRRRTDPYGGPRGTAVAWPTQRGFVNGVKDPDTGLLHIGARDYNATTGRFISIDPVFDGADPQSWNGYAYANNAPATSSDPTGLFRNPEAGQEGDDPGQGCVQRDDCYDKPTAPQTNKKSLWNQFKSGVKTGAKNFGNGIVGGVKQTATAYGNWFVQSYQGITSGEMDIWDPYANLFMVNMEVSASIGLGIWENVKLQVETANALAAGDVETAVAGSTELGLNAALAVATDGLGRAIKTGRAPKVCSVHSFSPATLVVMADGSHKAIEDIEVGDEVTTTDPEAGQTLAKPVTNLHINQDTDLTDVTVTAADGISSTLHTTQHHPFWDATDGRWVDAAQLIPGHQLLTLDEAPAQRVAAVDNFTGSQQMRDLTVADIHTYYVIVGKSPVLVHNCGSGGKARFEVDSSGVATDLKPLGRGSTGHTVPHTLKEQLGMESAMSNPAAGKQLRGVTMTDPRWMAQDGWVKMAQNVNGVEIHYVRNTVTGQVDDYKFR
ncbi:polymorphic toxin-type HINT domain-containing protein [Longispora sp. NPDC051575]|uniref:polymorphic toxin-type HINT domain-containing protein n=1 Tax=Longispora sp. NPDC051575 TaxID=3154943 RepID=UPI003448BB34